jgi:hypothetical protein
MTIQAEIGSGEGSRLALPLGRPLLDNVQLARDPATAENKMASGAETCARSPQSVIAAQSIRRIYQ